MTIRQTLFNRKSAVQFSKFALVGVLNTGISLAVFYLLYNLSAASYTTANFLSYAVGVINSFVWNKLWVFRAQGGNWLRESIVFLIVFAISYGIQYAGLYFMIECCGISPNWAQLPAMVLYTVVNYTLNRFVTFINPA